jgi:hypothetical protein
LDARASQLSSALRAVSGRERNIISRVPPAFNINAFSTFKKGERGCNYWKQIKKETHTKMTLGLANG